MKRRIHLKMLAEIRLSPDVRAALSERYTEFGANKKTLVLADIRFTSGTFRVFALSPKFSYQVLAIIRKAIKANPPKAKTP
jgi:hypothetical protein